MNRFIGGVAALMLLLAVPLSTGCDRGSDDVCGARDEVQEALDQLRNVNVIQQGTNSLRPALEQLREAVTDFADAAGDQFSEQATTLRAAIDNVTATVRDSAGMSLIDRARAIGDSLQQVVTVAGLLFQAAAAECP
ncbi:MAG: hypothetical protein ACRDJE_27595 [Dehalococcoidia bacterium]